MTILQPKLFNRRYSLMLLFAKVAKITGITLQIIEILPYYHNKTGFKEEKYMILIIT